MTWRRGDVEIAELEEQSLDPGLWDTPVDAQRVMQRLAAVRRMADDWNGFFAEVEALQEFAALDDPALETELDSEVGRLEADGEKREIQTLFQGTYDERDALLSLHAGAGGTDSQDWGRDAPPHVYPLGGDARAQAGDFG